MIGKTVVHYKILSKLGSGGMGDVYLAEDSKLQRRVAIKFLPIEDTADSEKRQRFLHEAGAHAKLNHSSIATFYDIQESDGHAFIVMEYVEGRTLAELTKSEKLSLSEVLDLCIQVGEGLQAAHAQGVIHRDIKPGNLMVTPDRKVKILDFGLARFRGASKITKTGTQMGTAAYMSPEQAESKKVDHRSDIFSLGIVMYELVCGRMPFEGESDQAILYDILNSPPQPMARYSRGVPASLEQVVFKALAKRTDERYQSTSDLLADLRRIKRELESGVSSGGLPTKASKRRRAFIATGFGVVIVAVALVVFNPFRWKLVEDRGAVAAERSLAIMYFDNLVDPKDGDRTSDILTSLLITDLSESEYLRVVSRQRLRDLLAQIGQETSRSRDQIPAAQVADRAGARYIVTGEIVQTQPTLVVTSTVSEAGSGVNVAAQKVAGLAGEDIFAVVDRLSAAIKRELKLPLAALRDTDPQIASITSRSFDAYRAYLEGMDYEFNWLERQAYDEYMEVLAHDSTFAMAYYRLAHMGAGGWGFINAVAGKKYLDQAIKYSTHSTWREQHLIKSFASAWMNDSPSNPEPVEQLEEIIKRYPEDVEALYELARLIQGRSDLKQQIRAFERVLEVDPRHKGALNYLVYAHRDDGDLEKALQVSQRYIEVAPNDPNPYSTRADLYLDMGRRNDAIQSLKQAVDIDSNSYQSLDGLGIQYTYKMDYESATACFKRLAAYEDAHARSLGRVDLSAVPMHKGQFRAAIRILDDGVAADRLDGTGVFFTMFSLITKASALSQLGDYNAAVDAIRESSRLKQSSSGSTSSRTNWLWLEAPLLARAGRFQEADSVLSEWGRESLREDTLRFRRYCYAMGAVSAAHGDWDKAVAYADTSANMPGTNDWKFFFKMQYAEVLLAAQRFGDAVRVLEDARKIYDHPPQMPEYDAKYHYMLARAYEASNWRKQAIEQYGTFLEMWKDADSDLPELADARQRLAALK